MYPTVRVVQPNRTQLYLVISEPLVIGRECDGLLLADEKVSRQHLRLAPGEGGGVMVTDLGSTNGTTVNGAAISQRRLDDGDVIALSSTTSFEFRAG